MGRIEDAIEKLQSTRRTGTHRVVDPIARLADRQATQEHAYRGRLVQVDSAALQRNGLLALDVEMRRIAEEYRAIKRRLLANATPENAELAPMGNLVMVGSALSGEGKTFTCVNLSLSIAREKDWDVILVDGDCSKPHLTRLFAAEKEPGLLDLIRDSSLSVDAVVMPTNLPGLSILPTGTRDQHAAELLASSRMHELCKAVSSADPRRLVIFDSSPLLLATEAQILASQMGQIALVVRANSTSQQDLLTALEQLDPAKPIGAILNQQAARLSVADGSYGYGYGYGDDE